MGDSTGRYQTVYYGGIPEECRGNGSIYEHVLEITVTGNEIMKNKILM